MTEGSPRPELIASFESAEKDLSSRTERGNPTSVAVDDPDNPKMQLRLDSTRSWSVQIGETNLKVGTDPSKRRLLNFYALVKDESYIELARRECREDVCLDEMAQYLLENRDRLLTGLITDMKTAGKSLKPRSNILVQAFRSIL